MENTKPEIVIDQHYKGYNPVQFGSETCDPGHFFGPSVRTHWLLHYVVYGFGIFENTLSKISSYLVTFLSEMNFANF